MKKSFRKPLGLPQQLRDELQIKDRATGPRRSTSIAAQRKQLRKTSRVQKRPQRPINRPAPVRYSKSIEKSHPSNHTIRSRGDDSEPTLDQGSTDEQSGAEDARFSDSEAENAPNESSAESEADYGSESDTGLQQEPRMSRGVRDKLAEEDAQIAALERKLGKRGKGKKGMESLLGELGELGGLSESEDGFDSPELKRKHDAEADEWLRSKRRKANQKSSNSLQDQIEEASDSFEGFDDSENDVVDKESAPKARENPYVAPTTAKYVPPSLRSRTTNVSDDERLRGLRRQVQGLLNRLSEANMIDVVKRMDQLFRENPRNDVSSVLIDLLMTSLADRAVLNDNFIILHAGFTAALYRVVGTDFGAKTVQDLVERCDSLQNNADSSENGKQESNLISFLAELYNFKVVDSKLIYDYIRIFTRDLSENSTELLLRIVRSSGQELRQDDPSSLKDVVLLLQESIKRVGGESNLSVRTRFMIETITNLKNNRMKKGQEAASIKTEHTIRMKKSLASMSSTKSVLIKTTEPIRVGLEDIRNSHTKGKWWLVGASFRDDAQVRLHQTAQNPLSSDLSATRDSHHLQTTSLAGEESDADMPDAGAAARSLGMNTDVRRAIFIGTMTATSIDEAYASLMKLSLTKRQTRELAVVLTRCVAAEQQYNPFYALLARKLGAGSREVRKTLWNPLLEVFSQLDQDDDDEHNNDPGIDDGGSIARWWAHPQARFNLSRFYGALIAHDVVSLAVLKNRDVLAAGASASSFLELLLVAVVLDLGRHKARARACFAALRDTHAAAPLRVFLERTVAASDLASPDERTTLGRGCRAAVEALRED